MISKREAAERLLARWLDDVASGEATLPLRVHHRGAGRRRDRV